MLFANAYQNGLTNSFGITLTEPISIYRFQGLPGQYLKFQRFVDSNRKELNISKCFSNLSFEFRTIYPTSMLLYFDDGNISFVTLQLAGGSIQLQFKFGPTESSFLKTGFGLNDNKWHKVKFMHRTNSIMLLVDGYPVTHWFESIERMKFTQQSHTYVSGVPKTLRNYALALPSIQIVQRFAGKMRSFFIDEKPAISLEKYLVWVDKPEQHCFSEK